jgi:hypothetical protein
MRAQAGFVLILGILIVIVVVVYYAFQNLVPPPVVGEEQKAIQEMIESIITSGAELSLKAVELQGGYLVPPNGSVALAYVGVPYWQICQNDVSPELDEVIGRLEGGIGYYVSTHTGEIKDFFGKNLSIGNVSRVDVVILDNRMDVSVYMPTRFRGYPISQPYRVSVRTRFRELFSFAKDMTAEMNRNPSQGGRFFETFTVASIYNSENLPTIGILTGCRDSIDLTPQDVSENLRDLAVYTMLNTGWWEEMSQFGSYAIHSVNGRQYQNLRPRLLFPDGFGVRSSTSIHIRNDRYISNFPLIPYCLTAYNIEYSFGYPVVINLNDSETGYDFNFAVYVNVEGMEAGDCYSVSEVETGPCEDPQCSAVIRIEDCSGEPLEGVTAYFGGCFVGTSDDEGWIEGPILCGTHELHLYLNDSYDYYSGNVSSGSLESSAYRLCRINNLTIHFNELNIEGHTGSEVCHPCAYPADCMDAPDTVTCEPPVTTNCTLATLESTQTGTEYTVSNLDSENIPPQCNETGYFNANPSECLRCDLREITVDYIPAGNYDLTVRLWDPATGSRYTGYLEVNFDLLESTRHLYMNIPNFGRPADVVSPSQNLCVVESLGGCGLETLRQT